MSGLSQEISEFISGTQLAVEANSNERSVLWSQWHKQWEIPWQERLDGYGVTIGRLAKMPICLSLLTAQVNGKKVLFFHPTSQVVDWRKIDQWMAKNLPGVRVVDASNFNPRDPQP